MAHHFTFLNVSTFLTYLLVFLVSISFDPSVHAQKFQPRPVVASCSSFIEGQGLYVFGGGKGVNTSAIAIPQAFMIDLSVSWNTSDPVYKELPDGPGAFLATCTMLSSGDEILMIVFGVGYIFNVRTSSWTLIPNNQLPFAIGLPATADPDSGLVFMPTNKKVLIGFDPKTKKVAATTMPALNTSVFISTAWCSPLQSILLISGFNEHLYSFKPSQLNDASSSNGWSTLNTKGNNILSSTYAPCFVPAYQGTKMVLFGTNFQKSAVYILDVATRSWKAGPSIPEVVLSACGVSGDQFIVWGGMSNNTATDRALVYNMASETWTSSYTAPPRIPETNLPNSPPPPPRHPTTTTVTSTPESGNTSLSETSLVIIIVVFTCVLLVIMLTGIFVFLRRTTKRSNLESLLHTNSNGPSSDSLETKVNVEHNIHVLCSNRTWPHSRAPIDTSSSGELPGYEAEEEEDSIERKRYVLGQTSRLQQGSVGTQLKNPEHPHAVLLLEESITNRNVQEGPFGARPLSQHPHAHITCGTVMYGDKEELE
ncbi:MAG: hypothetical protein J3Q66DRAFT_407392 [Benniella sp.]|nr:MAG: hypothetical protein J3Q66DRAFT_407392 [Benniella sp.]